MAFVNNWGFDGPLYEAEWATINALGARYAVETKAAWRVSQVPGNRQVSIAAGRGLGCGALAETDGPEVLAIPTPDDGRWYLIVARRTWATNSTQFVVVPGDLTTDTVQTVRPTTFPAALKTTPGVQDDQPLAWVHARSASTSMTVIDIRDTPFWIDYEPASVNTAQGYSYHESSYLRRRGNEVQGHVQIFRSTPLVGANEHTLLRIPADITPFSDLAFSAALVTGTHRGVCMLAVQRDGTVPLLYTTNGDAVQLRFEFSYLLT